MDWALPDQPCEQEQFCPSKVPQLGAEQGAKPTSHTDQNRACAGGAPGTARRSLCLLNAFSTLSILYASTTGRRVWLQLTQCLTSPATTRARTQHAFPATNG